MINGIQHIGIGVRDRDKTTGSQKREAGERSQ